MCWSRWRLGIAQAFAAARERARRGRARGRKRASRRRARCRATSTRSSSRSPGREVAKCKTPVAIFATGGFGRDELAPYLGPRPAGAVRRRRRAPRSRSWRRRSSIRCGTPRSTPGTRCASYDQALALPANDLAAATALLDARFLTGDEELADKFLAAFRARVAKTAAEDFVARLRAEQTERHSRFGDTIFLLEPDLKNGPGGMRDLCVGRWAATARFGTSDPKELLAQGGDDRAVSRRPSPPRPSGCCACAS